MPIRLFLAGGRDDVRFPLNRAMVSFGDVTRVALNWIVLVVGLQLHHRTIELALFYMID